MGRPHPKTAVMSILATPNLLPALLYEWKWPFPAFLAEGSQAPPFRKKKQNQPKPPQDWATESHQSPNSKSHQSLSMSHDQATKWHQSQTQTTLKSSALPQTLYEACLLLCSWLLLIRGCRVALPLMSFPINLLCEVCSAT